MDSRMRNGWRVALGALVFVGVLGVGGCSSVPKGRFDAAMQENADLRARNTELETALQEEKTRNGALEQERRDASVRGGGGGDVNSGEFGAGTTTTTRGSDIVVGVAGDVLFDSGSNKIKSTAKKTLDSIASALNGKYGGKMIRVEGYSDTDPIKKSSYKTNERLSAERALAVEEYLVSKGVSNSRVYSAAFGPASPKASKKESRRVEIVILGN